MRQKSGTNKAPSEQVVKDIRRATRKQYAAEDEGRKWTRHVAGSFRAGV